MNAEEGTAVFHPGAEGGALLLCERVAAAVVPDDELELAELLRVHHRPILCLEGRPTPALRDGGQRRVRGLNGRRVAEAVGLRKDQDSSRFESGRQSRRGFVEYRLRKVFV